MATLVAKDSLNYTAWKLGHYLFLQTERRDLLCHLIATALSQANQYSLSLKEIKRQIERLFGLNVLEQDLKNSLDALAHRKALTLSPTVPVIYTLSAGEAASILSQEQQVQALERTVLGEWEVQLRKASPQFPDDTIAELNKLLVVFLQNIYFKLGAEAINLSQGVDISGLSELDDERIPAEYKDVLMRQATSFFSSDDPTRRLYLRQWFNGSLCLHTLYLDTKSAKMLQKEWAKGVLFLDSNLIFRLIGLQGPEREEAALALVQLSYRAGFTVAVTTRTIAELNVSLNKYAQTLLAKGTSMTKAFAQQVLDDPTFDEDYLKAYCRHRVANDLSVEDFVAKYQNAKKLVSSRGVEVRDVTSYNPEETEEYQRYRKALEEARDKTDPVQEHDAFHLAYIDNQRRGRDIQNIREARVWFLTCDRSLLRYDQYETRLSKKRAVRCILADAWLAFLPSLLPMHQDFDTAWDAYVMNPTYRAYDQIKGDVVLRIKSNLDLYQSDPEMLAAALQDQTLVKSMQVAKTQEAEVLAVEDFLIRIADKYRVDSEEYQSLLGNAMHRIEEMTKQLAQAQAHHDDADRQAEKINHQLGQITAATNHQISVLETTVLNQSRQYRVVTTAGILLAGTVILILASVLWIGRHIQSSAGFILNVIQGTHQSIPYGSISIVVGFFIVCFFFGPLVPAGVSYVKAFRQIDDSLSAHYRTHVRKPLAWLGTTLVTVVINLLTSLMWRAWFGS